MSFIAKISDFEVSSFDNKEEKFMPEDLDLKKCQKSIRLFNDSIIMFLSIDKDLLDSLEKIDIAELEQEIKKESKGVKINKARREILGDILVEGPNQAKHKDSIKNCSDALSTRRRISRLLSQSF